MCGRAFGDVLLYKVRDSGKTIEQLHTRRALGHYTVLVELAEEILKRTPKSRERAYEILFDEVAANALEDYAKVRCIVGVEVTLYTSVVDFCSRALLRPQCIGQIVQIICPSGVREKCPRIVFLWFSYCDIYSGCLGWEAWGYLPQLTDPTLVADIATKLNVSFVVPKLSDQSSADWRGVSTYCPCGR